MKNDFIDKLTKSISRLPSLGPRSAKRIVLHMLRHKEKVFQPLVEHMHEVMNNITTCTQCGNFDTNNPCSICTDPKRDTQLVCVVESVADIWAMERSHYFKGRYFVLGGVLSAMEGTTPETLKFHKLLQQVEEHDVTEVILALSATVEGQTTSHYLAEYLRPAGVKLTALAQGMPIGGEIDYLDDGTIVAALGARKPITEYQS